jgi:hypothetical protein
VYAISDKTVTLGNLSSLPAMEGIWYGDTDALEPGINYKVAFNTDPVDPVDPVIPPLPPEPSLPTISFEGLNSTVDNSEEILRHRKVRRSGETYSVSYEISPGQYIQRGLFSMSTFTLQPAPVTVSAANNNN